MSRRDRVLGAIARQPVDRPPKGELCMDDEVIRTFLNIRDIAHGHRHEFARRLGMDLVCISPIYPEANGSGALPDPDRIGWTELIPWARDTDFFPFVLIEGVFGWGVRIWGFTGFMLKVAKNDPDVSALNRSLEIFNRRLAQSASFLGAAGIVLADDIAYQKGPIVSPQMLRDAFMPSYHRQVTAFKKMGMPVFFHSDGNLAPVLEDIAEAGFDGLQCIEEAAGMDLARVKKQIGHRLCLWGNLDPAYLTEPLGDDGVEVKVREIFKAASPGGGFIFGTSSGLFCRVRADLVQRAYREAERAPHRLGK